MVKVGTTAASVRNAILARPLAVHAGMPKKSTNIPCGRGHVGVHENSHHFACVHGSEQAAHEVVFVDGAVAVHGAIALDQPVKINIVQIPHHHVQRVPMQRMNESGKLPSAKVGGEKQDALAAGEGAFVVFEAVVDHYAAYIIQGVSGKLANLGQLTSQRGKFSAQNLDMFAASSFPAGPSPGFSCQHGAGELQQIDQSGQRDGSRARQGTRQKTQNFDERPRKRVLESLTHFGEGNW